MNTASKTAPQSLVPFEWADQFLLTRVIDGEVYAVQRFIFTCGLLGQVTFQGWMYDYKTRYCYASPVDAFEALASWDGVGDPPGMWIKEKMSERLGPGALKEMDI